MRNNTNMELHLRWNYKCLQLSSCKKTSTTLLSPSPTPTGSRTQTPAPSQQTPYDNEPFWKCKWKCYLAHTPGKSRKLVRYGYTHGRTAQPQSLGDGEGEGISSQSFAAKVRRSAPCAYSNRISVSVHFNWRFFFFQF